MNTMSHSTAGFDQQCNNLSTDGSDDDFNMDLNDDGYSVDFMTENLGQNSIKLMISQLRLTCVELKVALKLQGTNLLLHIDHLKKKHELLQGEVALIKRQVGKQQVIQPTETPLDVIPHENDATKVMDIGEIFQDTVMLQENTLNSTNVCISQSMEVKNGNSTEENECHTGVSENDASPLCAQVLEASQDVENSKITETVVQNSSENITPSCINCEEGSSNLILNFEHSSSSDCATGNNETSIIKHVQMNSFQNMFSCGVSAPSSDILQVSESNDSSDNHAEETNNNNGMKPIKTDKNYKSNFSDIKEIILKHLIETEGNGIELEGILRILPSNYEVVLNHIAVKHLKIVRVSIVNKNLLIAKTVSKKMIPKIHPATDRYYIVEYKKILNEQNSDKSATNCMGSVKFRTETFESSDSSILNSEQCINISPLDVELLSDDSVCAPESASGNITVSADIHTDQEILSLKRKSLTDLEDISKCKKSNNSDDYHSSPSMLTPKITSNSSTCDKETNTDSNKSRIVKPIILSNQVVKGDFYIKKIISDKRTERNATANILSASPRAIAPQILNSGHESRSTTIGKHERRKSHIDKNTSVKMLLQCLNTDKGTNRSNPNSLWQDSITPTNHNGIKYANSSTQQSLQSIMNQSCNDFSFGDTDVKTAEKYSFNASKNKGKNSKKHGTYVRTEKKQLSTIPSVTLREYVTWNLDDDEDETILNYNKETEVDEDVCIIEVVNTPIEID